MGGAEQMLGIDLRTVRIEDRRLDGPREEVVGMTAEELIERVLAGDVDGQPAAAAARTSPHLPEAGHGPGEGHADRGVELADVDPQLQRVRGDDAEQLAGAQPALDVLALSRRIAGPVGRDPLGEMRDRVGRLRAGGSAPRPCVTS